MSAPSPRKIRFGPFEVDLSSAELRRDGRLLRLQEQPFQLLAALLARPGEVVTREELRERLWAGDTFVDFDQGLNTAINKLRDTLADSASSPRFIETIPKRGYRFTFPLEQKCAEAHPVRPGRRLAPVMVTIAACLAAGVVVTSLLASRRTTVSGQIPLRRFEIRPQVPISTEPFFVPLVAISPNGRHIAFVAGEGDNRLWIRDLEQQQPRAVEGSEGAVGPFWSPESDFVGFAAGGELRKLPVKGGPAISICKLSGAGHYGGAWSPDGQTIVFSDGSPSKLHEVPAAGGTSRVLLDDVPVQLEPAARQKNLRQFHHPQFLPAQAGGRTVIVTVACGESVLIAFDLESKRTKILEAANSGVYSPTGHLIYRPRTGTPALWAVPFSLKTLSRTGESFSIASNAGNPTVATDSTLVYLDGMSSQLVWLDRQGRRVGQVGPPAEGVFYPALSPDGRFVAFEALENSNLDVWVLDITRGVRTRISSDPATEMLPVWSPRGEELAFSSYREGNVDIFVRRADAGPEEKPVAATAYNERVAEWSRDGRYMTYSVLEPKTGMDLWYLERDAGGSWKPHVFLQTTSHENVPKLSPDGRYVAYLSDESGRREVYVRPFPKGDRKWAVSTGGASQIRWTRNGRHLFYAEGDVLFAVPVRTQPEFEAGKAVRLFSHPAFTAAVDPNYDVSPDGEKILVPQLVDGSERRIHVVQNWFAEFRDRKR